MIQSEGKLCYPSYRTLNLLIWKLSLWDRLPQVNQDWSEILLLVMVQMDTSCLSSTDVTAIPATRCEGTNHTTAEGTHPRSTHYLSAGASLHSGKPRQRVVKPPRNRTDLWMWQKEKQLSVLHFRGSTTIIYHIPVLDSKCTYVWMSVECFWWCINCLLSQNPCKGWDAEYFWEMAHGVSWESCDCYP